MAYRKKKKKLTKKQQKQRTQLTLMSFIILFSFVFGLALGKSDNSGYSLLEKLEQFKEEFVHVFQTDNQYPKGETVLKGTSQFHFLDVGQGSATLLQSEDGTNILIDTGRYEDKDKKILTYLDRYIGTGGKIDLLIFTHNDSDHIGYGDLVLQYYDVKEVWMNGYDATSKIYERVLDAISDSNARYAEPKSGEEHQVGPFLFEILNPTMVSKNNPNDDSIVAKITFANFSGLFSGDASSRVEKEIIESGADLKATLLLMGHHGSKSSTSEEWIKAIEPQISVYSAGESNSYGHPNKETLERLNHQSIPIYGTIEDGTITVNVDSKGTYSVVTEKGAH